MSILKYILLNKRITIFLWHTSYVFYKKIDIITFFGTHFILSLANIMLEHKFSIEDVAHITECANKLEIFDFDITAKIRMLTNEVTAFLSHFGIYYNINNGSIITQKIIIFKFTNQCWKIDNNNKIIYLHHYELFLLLRRLYHNESRQNMCYRIFRDYIENLFYGQVTKTILFILSIHEIKYNFNKDNYWIKRYEHQKFDIAISIGNDTLYIAYNCNKTFRLSQYTNTCYNYSDLYDVKNIEPLYSILNKHFIIKKQFIEKFLLLDPILIKDIRLIILKLIYELSLE